MPRTVPVSTETAAYARALLAKFGGDHQLLVGSAETGETSPLPPHIAEIVRQVLTSLAAGHAVAVTENLSEMTPNEAAEFLNVSRTFVLKLMDEGALPFRTVGSYRRIPYADLVAYREAQMVRSRAAMNQLYKLDQDLGLHDLTNPDADAQVTAAPGSR